jgi:hypothetical protein
VIQKKIKKSFPLNLYQQIQGLFTIISQNGGVLGRNEGGLPPI